MVKIKVTKANKSNDKAGGKTKCKSANNCVSTARKTNAQKSFSTSNMMIPSCHECGIMIEEDTKALQCEKCEKTCAWICLECLGMSEDWYDSLESSNMDVQLHLFCRECETKVFEKCSDQNVVIDMVKELRTHMNMMEEKVDNIVHRLDSKVVDTDQVKEVHHSIEQKVDALATNVEKTAVVRDSVEDLVRTKLYEDKIEEEEQWKRKTSIIVHGLAEPCGNTPEERKHEDEDTIETLFHSLNLDDISVDNIIRLGKRPEQADAKPRPVKVVTASEEQKMRVLSKAKNLPRKKEGADRGIFMHQDLTPKQRMRRQELVKELKNQQSQGEKNLIIANWKIVERRSMRTDEV